jgi:hypothetical protein
MSKSIRHRAADERADESMKISEAGHLHPDEDGQVHQLHAGGAHVESVVR